MKLFLKIFMLLLCNTMLAQLPVLSTTSLANPDDNLNIGVNGNYPVDVNNERNQYVGTWEYTQNGIVLQLKIEKVDQVINKIEYQGVISNYSYCDEIVLRHKLVKNGITLNDNLNLGTINYVTPWGIKQGSRDFLFEHILDYTRNVVGSYSIKKLNTTPQKILFNLGKGNYTLKNPDSFYQD